MEDIKTQTEAADAILEHGIKFTVENSGFIGIFKKHSTFKLRQPYTGTLLVMSKIALSLSIDDDKIAGDPMGETWRVAMNDSKKVSRIIAIAILRKKRMIFFFSGMLQRYLLWRMTPDKLMQITVLLFRISNIENFLTATRLLRGIPITTPRNQGPEDNGG